MMGKLEALLRLLGDRRVVPPIPNGRSARVGNSELAATSGERDQSSAWSAFISYVDANGVSSERRVTCHQISGFGCAERVKAYCHERRALRSFRIDRIAELMCAESGELLDPIEHFEGLRLRGALGVEDKALTELARILVFLARCDGQYHPLEDGAVEQIFGRYALRFGGDDRMLDTAVTSARRLAPDADDIVNAIGRFSKSPRGPALCRFVLESGAEVIDADGHHAPEEIRWAVELSSALKSIADRKI